MWKFLIFVCCFLISCSSYPSIQKNNEYWIEEVKLWDGLGESFVPVSIKIHHGLIEEITKERLEKSSIVMDDYKGYYVIPGLINAHVHLLNPPTCKAGEGFTPTTVLKNLKQFLQSGYTTVADMGSWPDLIDEYREWTKSDPTKGPEILMAGPLLTIKGGYPDNWMPDMARAVGAVRYLGEPDLIADLKKYKVDYAKVGFQEKSYGQKPIPYLSTDQLKKFVVQAGQENIPVYVHALTKMGYETGLQGGAQAFLHGSHELLDQALIDQIADKKIPVIPTIWVWKGPWAGPEEEKTKLDEWMQRLDSRIVKNWNKYLKDYSLSTDFPTYLVDESGVNIDQAKRGYQNLVQNLKSMKAAGVPLIFGTDAPYCFDTAFNGIQEMRELKKVGFSNLEILQMATIHAARFLKIEDKVGTVEEGKRANLVLLKKDPLQNIEALDHPAKVIREGENVSSDQSLLLMDQAKGLWLLVKSFIVSYAEAGLN